MSGLMSANKNDSGQTLAQKRQLIKAKSVPIVFSEDRECDSCVLKDRCPSYKPGEKCLIDFMTPLVDSGDLTAALQVLLEQQYARLQRALYIENSEGGYPNKDVTDLMKEFVSTIKELKELLDPSDEIAVKAKGKNGTAFLTTLLGGKPNQ